MPMAIMGCDGLPQLGNAHHRRVLVVAIQRGVRRRSPDILRTGIIGKTLAEIDGVIVARGLRHRLEDGDRQIREYLVAGGHGDISRPPWSVAQPPSSR